MRIALKRSHGHFLLNIFAVKSRHLLLIIVAAPIPGKPLSLLFHSISEREGERDLGRAAGTEMCPADQKKERERGEIGEKGLEGRRGRLWSGQRWPDRPQFGRRAAGTVTGQADEERKKERERGEIGEREMEGRSTAAAAGSGPANGGRTGSNLAAVPPAQRRAVRMKKGKKSQIEEIEREGRRLSSDAVVQVNEGHGERKEGRWSVSRSHGG